jgi:hypothetical protein
LLVLVVIATMPDDAQRKALCFTQPSDVSSLFTPEKLSLEVLSVLLRKLDHYTELDVRKLLQYKHNKFPYYHPDPLLQDGLGGLGLLFWLVAAGNLACVEMLVTDYDADPLSVSTTLGLAVKAHHPVRMADAPSYAKRNKGEARSSVNLASEYCLDNRVYVNEAVGTTTSGSTTQASLAFGRDVHSAAPSYLGAGDVVPGGRLVSSDTTYLVKLPPMESAFNLAVVMGCAATIELFRKCMVESLADGQYQHVLLDPAPQDKRNNSTHSSRLGVSPLGFAMLTNAGESTMRALAPTQETLNTTDLKIFQSASPVSDYPWYRLSLNGDRKTNAGAGSFVHHCVVGGAGQTLRACLALGATIASEPTALQRVKIKSNPTSGRVKIKSTHLILGHLLTSLWAGFPLVTACLLQFCKDATDAHRILGLYRALPDCSNVRFGAAYSLTADVAARGMIEDCRVVRQIQMVLVSLSLSKDVIGIMIECLFNVNEWQYLRKCANQLAAASDPCARQRNCQPIKGSFELLATVPTPLCWRGEVQACATPSPSPPPSQQQQLEAASTQPPVVSGQQQHLGTAPGGAGMDVVADGIEITDMDTTADDGEQPPRSGSSTAACTDTSTREMTSPGMAGANVLAKLPPPKPKPTPPPPLTTPPPHRMDTTADDGEQSPRSGSSTAASTDTSTREMTSPGMAGANVLAKLSAPITTPIITTADTFEEWVDTIGGIAKQDGYSLQVANNTDGTCAPGIFMKVDEGTTIEQGAPIVSWPVEGSAVCSPMPLIQLDEGCPDALTAAVAKAKQGGLELHPCTDDTSRCAVLRNSFMRSTDVGLVRIKQSLDVKPCEHVVVRLEVTATHITLYACTPIDDTHNGFELLREGAGGEPPEEFPVRQRHVFVRDDGLSLSFEDSVVWTECTSLDVGNNTDIRVARAKYKVDCQSITPQRSKIKVIRFWHRDDAIIVEGTWKDGKTVMFFSLSELTKMKLAVEKERRSNKVRDDISDWFSSDSDGSKPQPVLTCPWELMDVEKTDDEKTGDEAAREAASESGSESSSSESGSSSSEHSSSGEEAEAHINLSRQLETATSQMEKLKSKIKTLQASARKHTASTNKLKAQQVDELAQLSSVSDGNSKSILAAHEVMGVMVSYGLCILPGTMFGRVLVGLVKHFDAEIKVAAAQAAVFVMALVGASLDSQLMFKKKKTKKRGGKRGVLPAAQKFIKRLNNFLLGAKSPVVGDLGTDLLAFDFTHKATAASDCLREVWGKVFKCDGARGHEFFLSMIFAAVAAPLCDMEAVTSAKLTRELKKLGHTSDEHTPSPDRLDGLFCDPDAVAAETLAEKTRILDAKAATAHAAVLEKNNEVTAALQARINTMETTLEERAEEATKAATEAHDTENTITELRAQGAQAETEATSRVHTIEELQARVAQAETEATSRVHTIEELRAQMAKVETKATSQVQELQKALATASAAASAPVASAATGSTTPNQRTQSSPTPPAAPRTQSSPNASAFQQQQQLVQHHQHLYQQATAENKRLNAEVALLRDVTAYGKVAMEGLKAALKMANAPSRSQFQPPYFGSPTNMLMQSGLDQGGSSSFPSYSGSQFGAYPLMPMPGIGPSPMQVQFDSTTTQTSTAPEDVRDPRYQ